MSLTSSVSIFATGIAAFVLSLCFSQPGRASAVAPTALDDLTPENVCIPGYFVVPSNDPCSGYICTCDIDVIAELCYTPCEGCFIAIDVTLDCSVAAGVYEIKHTGFCESSTRQSLFCPLSSTSKVCTVVMECRVCGGDLT